MNRTEIRLGCVGLRRGWDLLTNIPHIKGVRIAAICDRDEERLKNCENWLKGKEGHSGFRSYASYSEMLDSDIDAVIIATEAGAHVTMSVEALKKGKHVLSEIPAINSLEEAKALYSAVRDSGLKYMLGENCCFWAFVNTWKHMREEGLLGDIWYAEAEYLHNVTELMRDREGRPTWRSSYDAIKYLTHDLGPLLYIMDDHCVSVSGFAPSINPIAEYSTGTPNEVAIFKTAKGALIKIFVSFGLVKEPACHNFSLYGSKGTLETSRSGEEGTLAYLKSIPNTERSIHIPVGISYPGLSDELKSGHGGGDFIMVKSFIDSILEDTKPLIDVEMAVRISLPGIFAHASTLNGSQPAEIPGPEDLLKP